MNETAAVSRSLRFEPWQLRVLREQELHARVLHLDALTRRIASWQKVSLHA